MCLACGAPRGWDAAGRGALLHPEQGRIAPTRIFLFSRESGPVAAGFGAAARIKFWRMSSHFDGAGWDMRQKMSGIALAAWAGNLVGQKTS